MAAETGKQLRSSGSSSDESDPGKDEGLGSTIRRSFECTYCKRGFTNAQALGGHMNIHRKDRANTKKATGATKNTNSYSDDVPTYMMDYRKTAPNMSTSAVEGGYGNWDAQRAMMSSHHDMVRPAAMYAAPNLPIEHIGHGQELGSNLTLRVGASTSNNVAWNNIEDHDENDNNEDVDLELRLGPG